MSPPNRWAMQAHLKPCPSILIITGFQTVEIRHSTHCEQSLRARFQKSALAREKRPEPQGDGD